MIVFVGWENETGGLGSGDAPRPTRRRTLSPLDCRPGTACAILPLRPEPGSWYTRAVEWNRYHEGE